jgi:hypothetical protein
LTPTSGFRVFSGAFELLCGTDVPLAAVRGAVACATVSMLGAVALLMWQLPATVDLIIAVATAVLWTLWLDRQGDR